MRCAQRVGNIGQQNEATVISEMLLKFGRVPGAQATPIAVSAVTVFVGPNNSGKSRVLAEIEHFCIQGQVNGKLLRSLTFTGLSAAEADRAIENLKDKPADGEARGGDEVFIASRRGRVQLHLKSLKAIIQIRRVRRSSFQSGFYNT
jgi:hypothetical protein